jgi:hypothetical protein
MPQIHPDPILPPSVVKNALVDPVSVSRFSSFPPLPCPQPWVSSWEVEVWTRKGGWIFAR